MDNGQWTMESPAVRLRELAAGVFVSHEMENENEMKMKIIGEKRLRNQILCVPLSPQNEDDELHRNHGHHASRWRADEWCQFHAA